MNISSVSFLFLFSFSCERNQEKKDVLSTENVQQKEKTKDILTTRHLFGTDIKYQKLSVGYDHVCALRLTGEIDCVVLDEYGEDEFGAAKAPKGKFVDVMTGIERSCGIRETGEFVCWGSNVDRFGIGYFQELYPMNPPYSKIHIGMGMVCALNEKKMAHCFARANYDGEDGVKPSDVPEAEGPFEQFSMKNNTACGVRHDGSSSCWMPIGDAKEFGTHFNKSDESWKFVTSSFRGFAIGVTTKGELRIWGRDVTKDLRESPEERTNPWVPTPLEGKFIDADINHWFHCARDKEGLLHCKFNSGDFTHVEYISEISIVSWGLGVGYGCGLDEQGIIHCWY